MIQVKWITLLILLYFAYYTISFAVIVWKEGNKFAGMFISLLGISIVLIPVLRSVLSS